MKKESGGATIKDVARETNLAISTISKYMNGGKVRKKNQELIEAAVRKLHYFPNNTARWLRTSRSYRIGVVSGIVNSPHTSSILNEIEKYLRNQGYSVSFFSFDINLIDENLDKTKGYIRYMIENGMDGMLLTIPGDGCIDFDPIFEVLEKAGYEGYMVVEAEQDPAKANPFEYALKARGFIREKTGL